MSNFGPIIGGWTVERAVGDTLLLWLGSVIHEIEDNEGIERGSIPVPASYTRVNSFRRLPEDPAPVLLIVSPGTIGEPVRESGEYSAKWQIHTGIISNTPAGEEMARDLAQYYIAAIRTVMIKKADLGGLANGVEWAGEQYQDIGNMNERSHAAARDVFRVEVGGVSYKPGGPAEPDAADDTPHEDDPIAETVDTTITQEAINE